MNRASSHAADSDKAVVYCWHAAVAKILKTLIAQATGISVGLISQEKKKKGEKISLWVGNNGLLKAKSR